MILRHGDISILRCCEILPLQLYDIAIYLNRKINIALKSYNLKYRPSLRCDDLTRPEKNHTKSIMRNYYKSIAFTLLKARGDLYMFTHACKKIPILIELIVLIKPLLLSLLCIHFDFSIVRSRGIMLKDDEERKKDSRAFYIRGFKHATTL